MQVCIIGAGVVGCSVALELRRRGAGVTVVDKNGEVGHGSTSASCGIVRRFYSQPGMVAMAQEGACIWQDWPGYLGPIDDAPARFLRPGMLFIPPRIDDDVHGIVAEMQRLGIPASVLDADEVRRRFPFLDPAAQFPPRAVDDPAFFEPTGRRIEGAVWEEDAGYVVSPGLATTNLRLAAERDGAVFRMNREVVAARPLDGSGFRLELAGGENLQADVLVNVAGPHSAVFNRRVGVTLPLETRALRREVHALRNPRYSTDAGAGVPVVGDLDGGIYFRPEAGGHDLIVGTTDPACDEPDWVDDPDDFPDTLTDRYRERHCYRAMKRFPELRLGPARGVASLYDVTVQDWYPIADRTDLPGYYVCIGTSGSSFKTAPVLGRLMAELIDAGEGGRDTDREPLRFELPRAGTTIDPGFLSRNRGKIRSTGTVIG